MYEVSRHRSSFAWILAAALLWIAAPAGASNGNACGDLDDVHAPVQIGGGVDVNEALDAISGRSLYHGLIDTSFHVATLKSWDYQSLFDRMRDQRVKRYHDPTASLGGTWNAARSLQEMYAAANDGRIVVADVIEEPEAGEEAPPPRRRPEPLPEPAPAPPPPAVVPPAASVLGAWAIGFGVAADQDEDFSCTRSEQDWDAGGFTLGLDKSVNDYSSVGLLGGYHHMDGDFDDFGTEADDDAGSVGLYGTWANGSGVHGSLAAYYTYHDWDTEKEFSGLEADSEPNGHQATVYGSIGYDVRMGAEGDTTLGPYAALQYSFLHIDDFDEDASSISADYDEEDFDSLASQLGARLAHRMKFGWGTLTPEVRAAWLHEFLGDDEDVDGAFLAGGPFSFDTDVAERDYALVGAGFTATFASWPNVHLFLGYDGRFGDEFDSHGGTGGLWIEF